MSNYVLDKAYRITSSSGIEAGRVVVRGDAEGDCKLPAVANSGNVLGVTTHSQPRQNRFVAVRRMGLVMATAAGAIEAGSLVRVADTAGRIAQLARPKYIFGTGTSEVIVEWLDRPSYSPSITLSLNAPGEEAAFSWSLGDLGFVINLTSEAGSGDVVETVASLVSNINADATLSRFLRATKGASAVDATVVSDGTASPTNLVDTLNPIGIAEQSSTQQDDLIDVLLIP